MDDPYLLYLVMCPILTLQYTHTMNLNGWAASMLAGRPPNCVAEAAYGMMVSLARHPYLVRLTDHAPSCMYIPYRDPGAAPSDRTAERLKLRYLLHACIVAAFL